MKEKFNPQPGWATPIAPRFEPSYLERFMGLFRGKGNCLAVTQGQCPGKGLCHDCHWAEGSSRGSTGYTAERDEMR